MRRLGPGAHAAAALAAGLVLVLGGLVPSAAAQGPDKSDVVLVLDFSASILEDATNRNRFGAALERIADRVDAISTDLVVGDTAVSIVQFATRAADVAGCADLKLLNSPATVAQFANCLRSVAAAYRKGLTSALTNSIGIDTNYVAAMEAAARHLPVGAERPALILFTDGKHDVKGVPVSQVLPARDRLFGSRSSFALLPVGMGLDPAERGALAAGLQNLEVIRNMPACVSGTAFEWPQVVFQSADEAGNAVAVAFQDATCTFTAAPTPTPPPAPSPAAVTGIVLTPGDGQIEVDWSTPISVTPSAGASAVPIVDYLVQCQAADGSGAWIDSTEGVSLDTKATVNGLTNGTAYQCEVATVGPSGPGAWTIARVTATPVGRPPAPGKPSVEALNSAIRISSPPGNDSTVTYHYECTDDGGTTWPVTADTRADIATAQISHLTNGVDYRCRAYAQNSIGVSDPSVWSDSVRPCNSVLQCNAPLVPILGGLAALLLAGVVAAMVVLIRGRSPGYVVAVLDVVHTANIGHGSRLGISIVRQPDTRRITGIVADKGRHADIRIRRLRGGRFAVSDRTGRKIVKDGDAVVVADSVGVRHSLALRAFAGSAASRVARSR